MRAEDVLTALQETREQWDRDNQPYLDLWVATAIRLLHGEALHISFNDLEQTLANYNVNRVVVTDNVGGMGFQYSVLPVSAMSPAPVQIPLVILAVEVTSQTQEN